MQNHYRFAGAGMAMLLSACVATTSLPPSANSMRNRLLSTHATMLARAPADLSKAVRANPNNNEAWFQLGNGLAEQDQLVDAEAAYRQALMLGPHVKALHNLGLVHIRLGIEALRSSSAQLPKDHPSREETRNFLELMSKAGF